MALYIVTNRETGVARLIGATNKAQAIRHVAADTLAIEVASTAQAVKLVTAGVKPEYPGEDDNVATSFGQYQEV